MQKRSLLFALSLIFLIQAEARGPRTRDGWDELKDDIRCIHNVRKFLTEKNYLGGLRFNEDVPKLESYSGTPLRKIKCAESLIEAVRDGLGRCSTDSSRAPFRFTGFGLDCPHRYVELIEFESSSGQRYEAKIVQDDDCDREPVGELFTKRKISKKPESIRDEVMINEAKQALKEAAMETYRAINVSRGYAGNSAQQITARLEHELNQNVFHRTSCAVSHSRDPDIGEVMRAAANRACAEKLRLYPNERCMISMADYRYDSSAPTTGITQQQCRNSNAFINCDVISNGATAEPFSTTRTPTPPRPPSDTNCDSIPASQRAACLRNLADYQRDLQNYQRELNQDGGTASEVGTSQQPCSNVEGGSQARQDGRCVNPPSGQQQPNSTNQDRPSSNTEETTDPVPGSDDSVPPND